MVMLVLDWCWWQNAEANGQSFASRFVEIEFMSTSQAFMTIDRVSNTSKRAGFMLSLW